MSAAPEVNTRTEIRDGMRITWHAPIPVKDGVVLRADVYRPSRTVAIRSFFPTVSTQGARVPGRLRHAVEKMVADHPEILEGSTNKYQAWEVTDPERWVRTATPSSGSIPAVPAGRLGSWIRSARRKTKIWPSASRGRHAGVEQRQGRDARDLVLRRQSVARRGQPSPAAPGGDHPVGGVQRLLP